MKRLKKILALAIAMAMVLASLSMTAFAAYTYTVASEYDANETYYSDQEGTVADIADIADEAAFNAYGGTLYTRSGEEDTPATPTTPATGSVTSDKILTVENLKAGDKVNLYKVVEWVDGQGWKLTSAFAALGTVGNANYSQNIADIVNNNKAVTLSEADVKAIEAIVQAGAAAVSGSPFTLNGETFTYGTNDTPADPGLYLAIVAAQTAGVVYNPIVVAADYSTTNGTNTIDAEQASLTRLTDTASTSIAKKETITVEKVADDTTHDTGDEVTFTITTTVPLYSTSYTNPVFRVTDTLSDNLSLQANSIKVYKTGDENKTELVENPKVTKATSGIIPSTADFQITFTSTYLGEMKAALPITIEYKATFTNNGGTSVEVEDNTVDVTYSNNPSESGEYGTIRDETKHYTFTIDGDLLGHDGYTTSEVVKVGLDADGNEITQTTTLSNEKTIGALQGAKFALFTSNPTSAEVASETAAKASSKIYKNTNYANGCIVTSDASGHIKIEGLDADNNDGAGTTYYLAEIEAPNGYVKDSTVYPVTIIPVFADHVYTDGTDETLTWTVSELQSYKVKINNVETASYTFTNNSEATTLSGDAGDISTASDTVVGTAAIRKNDGSDAASRAGKIQNTQGVALPSTGGIGTTIFYVVGAILVIGAGVVLITKRRMEA